MLKYANNYSLNHHVHDMPMVINSETFWNAQSYYNEGDIVLYEGIHYRALRWNINEVPLLCITGAWEEYKDISKHKKVSRIGLEYEKAEAYYTPVQDKVFLELQDEEVIKSVLKSFDFKKIKAFNIAEDKICTRLLLPTRGDEGTTLIWESNAPQYISNTGEVRRPKNGKDYPVWLQLSVCKGELYATKVFELWVSAENTEPELNEEESVELAFKSLNFNDFKGKNSDILNIRHDLNFSVEGKYGVKLAWLSMQKSYLKDDGKVNRENLTEDKVVKLHVVIRKGSAQRYKRFFLNIKGEEDVE